MTTIKVQHENYSIKCLASSFALKQALLIQVSFLKGKQNFSSCLSSSRWIFRNSIYNCLSCSTVPLEMCGAWPEAFGTCFTISYLKSFTFLCVGI